MAPSPEARARDAGELLWRGEFDAAVAELHAVLANSDVPLARRLLASAYYADDELDAACREFEHAYRGFRDAGDIASAARCAMALAELHHGSLGNRAVGHGWLARARRLLEEAGPCVDWGYLELALMACDLADVDELERSAERALRIAAEYRDRDLEVLALANSGLALVSQGRRDDGFARLDEAMAAIVGGEIASPQVAGICFCAMLSSCDRAGDVRRATEWLRAIEAAVLVPMQGRPRVLHTHCRVAYGSVLCSAGRWTEAEAAMLDALTPQASRSLGHRVEVSARLAELRIQQGRLVDAAALLAPYEDTLPAAAPLALLHLARGEPDFAAAVARRGRRELVGDVSRAVPLLAVLVQAEIARGDVDAAERATDELAELAGRTSDVPARAYHALSAGRTALARGDCDASARWFEAALSALGPDERPLIRGLASLELAEASAAAGDAGAAVAEGRAALAVFERLGARPLADRAGSLLRRLGAPSRGRPHATAAVASLTAREREVLALIGEGLTNSEIGTRLYISAKTAEHHVGRILTKLAVRTRAEAAAVAAANRGTD